MESYTPLQIARSDGQGYDFDEVERIVKPEDKTQVAGPQSEHALRWKIQIGSHLKYQLAPEDNIHTYILKDFPAGYELRTQLKGLKNHMYLYGHPKDPKARYRTHGEFVPHLLWLISDSVDRQDCSCHLCVDMTSKEGPESGKSAKALTTPPAIRSDFAPSLAPSPAAPQAPAKPPQPQTSPKTSPQEQMHLKQASAAGPATVNPNIPWASTFTPTPSGTTSVVNLFRVGEMVWFKESAWRLGIVFAINAKNGSQKAGQDETHYTFVVAPLGHAIFNKGPVLKEAVYMRPFLTFSVPHPTIQELVGLAFTELDWPSFKTEYVSRDEDPTNQHRRTEGLHLEASKMAARLINSSFSVLNRLPGNPITPTAGPRLYTGVYLGAELIVLGDAIRVTPPTDTAPVEHAAATIAVMIVHEIVLTVDGTPDALDAPRTLHFRGDIHRLSHDSPLAQASDYNRLGPVCLEELAFRNRISNGSNNNNNNNNNNGSSSNSRTGAAAPPSAQAHLQQGPWSWTLLERDAERGEADVHGRFYVTPRLMQIVDPDRLRSMLERRAVEDSDAFLNSRMHNDEGGPHVGFRPSRDATLGQAVSTRIVLPEGLVENQHY